MIDYYLIMRNININTILLFPAFVLFSFYAIRIAAKSAGNPFITTLNLFAGYCLFTLICYGFNHTPLACFVGGVKSFLFPIVFAYMGYVDKHDDQFNTWYIYACLFCFICGLYLYFSPPSYYTEFLIRSRDAAWNTSTKYISENNVMDWTRFSSFFSSSYAIQYFGIPSLAISLVYSTRKNVAISKWICYIIALVSFISCILSQQRMAMAWAIFLPLFLGVYYGAKRNYNILKAVIISIVIIFLLMGFILSLERFDVVSEMVRGRFEQMNFVDALESRTGQFQNFSRTTPLSMIFGLGLGSCSGIAGAYGLEAVFDSEFPKMFYELGMIGIVLFLILIIPTIIRGTKFFRHLHMELLIIIFFLVAGIGSDSLTFFLFDVIFWYAMGRIWNKNYLSFRLQNN